MKALVLFALLHGSTPGLQLVIGLNASGGFPFAARGHAWVSIHGRPIFRRDALAPLAFRPLLVIAEQ